MAKVGPRNEIRRRGSAGTGTVDATTKDRRTTGSKLELRSHDPAIHRHVPFHEIEARGPQETP